MELITGLLIILGLVISIYSIYLWFRLCEDVHKIKKFILPSERMYKFYLRIGETDRAKYELYKLLKVKIENDNYNYEFSVDDFDVESFIAYYLDELKNFIDFQEDEKNQ